jgi:hypothetical protein
MRMDDTKLASGLRFRSLTGIQLPVTSCLLVTQIIAADDASVPGYNRDIRPILADRCFACHGPDSGTRQAELRFDTPDGAHESAIVPGDAAASEIIARVTSEDPDVRMPRNRKSRRSRRNRWSYCESGSTRERSMSRIGRTFRRSGQRCL